MICGKCKKTIDKLPFSNRQLCPKCEEEVELELEDREVLAEQNHNYWQDTCGSIK